MENHINIVRASQVTKNFPMGKSTVQVLKGIDLEIGMGEYISIMGPSGSGKTTFLNAISGLDSVSDGEVWLGGKRVLLPSGRYSTTSCCC